MQVTAADFGPSLVVPHLSNARVVLRRETVADHRARRGRFRLFGRVVLSDALVRAAEARKLRGPKRVHLEEA